MWLANCRIHILSGDLPWAPRLSFTFLLLVLWREVRYASPNTSALLLTWKYTSSHVRKRKGTEGEKSLDLETRGLLAWGRCHCRSDCRQTPACRSTGGSCQHSSSGSPRWGESLFPHGSFVCRYFLSPHFSLNPRKWTIAVRLSVTHFGVTRTIHTGHKLAKRDPCDSIGAAQSSEDLARQHVWFCSNCPSPWKIR